MIRRLRNEDGMVWVPKRTNSTLNFFDELVYNDYYGDFFLLLGRKIAEQGLETYKSTLVHIENNRGA